MTGQVTALVALAGAVLLLGLLVSLALGRRKRSASSRSSPARPGPRAQRGALPSVPVPASAARSRPNRAVRRSGSRSPSPACAARSSSTAATAPASRSTRPSRSSRSPPPGSRRPTVTGSSRSRSPASTPPAGSPTSTRPWSTPAATSARCSCTASPPARSAAPPTFADIAGELLDRLDGAVVVLHDGAFVERFLDAEFARAGVALPLTPALCSRVAGPPDAAHPRPHAAHAVAARRPHRPRHDLRARRRPHHGRPAAADARRARPAVRYLCGLRPMPELDIRRDPATRPVDGAREHRRAG